MTRVQFHATQGITPAEQPSVVADLTALRDDVQPRDAALAAKIDGALKTLTALDPATARTLPTLRTTAHPVLYSDLFQSQFGNYLFNLMRFDFGPSLGAVSGEGCVSMNNPSAPAPIAASVSGGMN